MLKSLDQKLAAIHADPDGCKDFILADAKDQDMAFGLLSTGERLPGHPSPESSRHFPYRSLEEFRDQIRGIIRQGLCDIVLMSASTAEKLAIGEKLFENSHVTPAARANDTTDIWSGRGAVYPTVPSRPFRTATLDQIQCGKHQCEGAERRLGPDLGLYSVTFMNDVDRDRESLLAYKEFRLQAEAVGFRHFLEVFSPNISGAVDPKVLGHFINDNIVRALAAVPMRSRPVFLKTVFHGPRFVEDLVHYDPHLIVGVLGGSAGTTFDAFDLLHQARKAGARAALFGRKINQAEHQPAFVKFLRLIADGQIAPAEAVRAYHGVLQTLGIKARRDPRDDSMATVDLMAGEEKSSASFVIPEMPARESAPKFSPPYAAPTPAFSPPYASAAPAPTYAPTSAPTFASPGANGSAPRACAALEPEPDFDKMSLKEKLDYNQKRRDQIFG